MVKEHYFRHGELPLIILALVDNEPMHGYQLLARIARMCAPAYEPSTGSLYPAISVLEDAGYIEARADGRRRVYRPTRKGRAFLQTEAHRLAEVEARLGIQVLAGEGVKVLAARFAADLLAAAPNLDVDDVAEVLDKARAALGIERRGAEG